MTAEQSMTAILMLDPDASVRYSTYTARWYVVARIEVGDGVMLLSPTEHRRTPEDAVVSFLVRIARTKPDEFLVTHHADPLNPRRQHWRWTGRGWTELPVPTPHERLVELTGSHV